MHMRTTGKRWRVDEVRRLPDDGSRYEVIRGELLVTPSPSPIHQRAVLELAILLNGYLDRVRIGQVFVAPGDVIFDDETMVQPDEFVVPSGSGPLPRSWSEMPRPLLAVEVLSFGTARDDRGRKRRLYQEEGVAEYWIVDPASRVVERWHPGDARPEILSERLEWRPDAASEPLVIDLERYFARIWEES